MEALPGGETFIDVKAVTCGRQECKGTSLRVVRTAREALLGGETFIDVRAATRARAGGEGGNATVYDVNRGETSLRIVRESLECRRAVTVVVDNARSRPSDGGQGCCRR